MCNFNNDSKIHVTKYIIDLIYDYYFYWRGEVNTDTQIFRIEILNPT